jgi:hypothetical protein
MKAAIAGKDGEQFPGDEQQPAPQNQAALPPTAAAPAPVLTRTSLDQAARPASSIPGATPPAQPAAKPSATSRASSTQVRPVLPQVYVPPRPQGAVRRALNPNP